MHLFHVLTVSYVCLDPKTHRAFWLWIPGKLSALLSVLPPNATLKLTTLMSAAGPVLAVQVSTYCNFHICMRCTR